MLHSAYKGDMERVSLDSEQMERLEALMAGRRVRPHRRMGRRAVAAAAVCAALFVTALAAGPNIWQTLKAKVGPFAPYTESIDGTAIDQGLEVKLVGSMTDGYSAKVYYTITDLTGDRLNDHTAVSVGLAGTSLAAGSGGSGIISYDAEQKQLLMEAAAEGLDFSAPVTLHVTGLQPGYHSIRTFLPLGFEEQPLEGTDGAVTVSSMGLESDGVFHVRLRVAPGCDGKKLFVLPRSKGEPDSAKYQTDIVKTELDGGYEYRLPAVTADTLEDVKDIQIYGVVYDTQPAIVGTWSFPIQLKQVEQKELAVGRDCGGYLVERVLVSPLGVTIFYQPNAEGRLFVADRQAQIILDNGDIAPMNLSISGAVGDKGGSYSVWRFDTPVELADMSAIQIMDQTMKIK